MIFNSPIFGNCNNLEIFYENEEEFWRNLQEYIDENSIEEHKLWNLVSKNLFIEWIKEDCMTSI
jgi:hypothetical protein